MFDVLRKFAPITINSIVKFEGGANIHRSRLNIMVSVSQCDSIVVLNPITDVSYCDKVTVSVSQCDGTEDESYIYAFLVPCVIAITIKLRVAAYLMWIKTRVVAYVKIVYLSLVIHIHQARSLRSLHSVELTSSQLSY